MTIENSEDRQEWTKTARLLAVAVAGHRGRIEALEEGVLWLKRNMPEPEPKRDKWATRIDEIERQRVEALESQVALLMQDKAFWGTPAPQSPVTPEPAPEPCQHPSPEALLGMREYQCPKCKVWIKTRAVPVPVPCQHKPTSYPYAWVYGFDSDVCCHCHKPIEQVWRDIGEGQ